MSREIKFRYVFKCGECGHIIIKEYSLHEIQFGHVDSPEHVHGNLRFCYGFKDRVQFTGLHDKDGTEIYEGDIVRGNFDGWLQRGVVVYDSPRFKLKWESVSKCEHVEPHTDEMEFTHPKFYHQRQREVIGNIYENPELLEGTK